MLEPPRETSSNYADSGLENYFRFLFRFKSAGQSAYGHPFDPILTSAGTRASGVVLWGIRTKPLVRVHLGKEDTQAEYKME